MQYKLNYPHIQTKYVNLHGPITSYGTYNTVIYRDSGG